MLLKNKEKNLHPVHVKTTQVNAMQHSVNCINVYPNNNYKNNEQHGLHHFQQQIKGNSAIQFMLTVKDL